MTQNGLELLQRTATVDMQADDAGKPAHLDLVVSHCDRPLNWISFFVTRPMSSVTVYSKCNQTVEGAPAQARIIRMDNIGRCDHTYAHWLVQQGNRIPPDRQANDLILFVKDNDMSDRHIGDEAVAFEEMVHVATGSARFACGRWWPKHSLYHVREALGQFRHGNLVYKIWQSKDKERDQQAFTSNFSSLAEWTNAMGFRSIWENHTLVPVCYGGLFLTTYSQILRPLGLVLVSNFLYFIGPKP